MDDLTAICSDVDVILF